MCGDTVKFEMAGWHSLVSGQRPGALPFLQRALLALASLPYCLAIRIRNCLYDVGLLKQHHARVPVVVVGNLTVGGTGKTPAVEWVAQFYRKQDRQVAILSRGYGSSTGRNDEALVLENNLIDVPHLQDADRVKLAHIAIDELERDLLVLDDGFQHRRLKRDLDIVLVDATNPWGFGWCLPRGLLREPKSGLRRAGMILITRADLVDEQTLQTLQNEIHSIAPRCPIVISKHSPQTLHNTQDELSLDPLKNRPVAAFCGIGNPNGFWKTLERLGCTIVDRRTFPDHYAYQREDVHELSAWATQLPADTWILTTQKDWVKLRVDYLGDKPLWSLRIMLEITQGRPILESTLLSAMGNTSRDRSISLSDSSLLPFPSKDAYDYASNNPV